MRTLVMSMLVACVGIQAAEPTQAAGDPPVGKAEAIFAGGCFWCLEGPFERLNGVVSVESGYTGGLEKRPAYREVARGETGHFEAVRIVFEPEKIDYATLLSVFWTNIDPTQSNGQFCDKGDQYRSAIFVANASEQKQAAVSKKAIAQRLGRSVVTPILPTSTFWLAEDYHQDFYKKNPTRYKSYRTGCGRDRRLEQLWGSAAGKGTIQP